MNILEDYENGKLTAAQAFALLSKEAEIIKQAIDIVKPDAIAEAQQFNKGEVYYGFTWEVRNGRTTYDFEADPEYKRLNEMLKERRALLTEASKKAARGQWIVEEHTGETIEAVPVKSVASDSLIFKKVN